ncbi:hypothetical protein [Thermus thalpophilus]|uniref:hypothetical protein n=1 Tax=Thermus thalpophilus TaxID=2908147 RepID=UPI001FA9FB9A|nr:hypothetical protein [Thermus thalpophilus]
MSDNWMEQLLYRKHFLVSGTADFARHLSLPEGFLPSLRFIAWSTPDEPKAVFFLVVENVSLKEAPPLYEKLEKHYLYSYFKEFWSPFSFHLLLTLRESDPFFFFNKPYTYKQLASWFYSMAPELGRNLGTSKETNRLESQRQSDLFRTFTRLHLSRFCVANDIDAVRLQKPALLLELKRPKESVKNWKPYVDDCANYMYLRKIAQKVGAEFRIIAYNHHYAEHVRLVLEPKCGKPNRSASYVKYRTALLKPEEALESLDPSNLSFEESSRRRQKN